MATATRTRKTKVERDDVPEIQPGEAFGNFTWPYAITVTIAGVKTYFFSRPDMDEWDKKEASAPGSRTRKEVNLESLVWRTEAGTLAFPSTQFKVAMITAGRYSPDPSKTGRRSAGPFIGEAISVAEDHVEFLDANNEPYEKWDEVDRRIAKYAHNKFGPRTRPILNPGWRATCTVQVLVPELIAPGDVLTLINRAGMVRGIGDNTKFGFGRFVVEGFSEPFEAHW